MQYDNTEVGSGLGTSVASTLQEMSSSFADTYASAEVKANNNKPKVTLQRTSLTNDDMGNILYFRQYHDYGNAIVKIISFVVTFECIDNFGEILRPDASDLSKSAVSCVSLPFQTQRADFGQISSRTDNEYTSYKYYYKNVKDLAADFLFYDEYFQGKDEAVPGETGNGTIKTMETTDAHTFLGVKNSTYWLETPIDALAQDNLTKIPVGYRIVGARVVYSNSVDPDIKVGDDIYITDGNGRYMNYQLNFTTDKVSWKYNNDKTVSTQNGNTTVYLRHKSGWLGYSYELTTTTKKSDASPFETDGLNLYYYSSNNRYVISYDDDGKGGYSEDAQHFAVVSDAKFLEPSDNSYTLTVYDKTGENVFKTVTVDKDHPFGDVVLEKINNDAIKLKVDGLEGDNLAYLCLEVQLEALNPYIDKMDITCTEPSGNKTLKNQYLADDFTIGLNGNVDFAVPTNFGSEVKFAFEGLHHKNADETYTGIGTLGQYSRYHFVNSDYYKIIGENLQGNKTAAADYDYTKKLSVNVAGDKQFECNNSDRFKAGTSGNEKFYYTENRYSNAAYANQGGAWSEVTAKNGDGYQTRYLIVCDETRYNIAPTTKPRHAFYAYYSTNLKLTTVDYQPEIEYTKVYDNGMLPTGFDKNKYVGAKVRLNGIAEGTGYVYAKQIVDKINGDINNKVNGAPVDAKHILYFDASGINTVLFSNTDATWGKLEDLQAILGDNALIYLPQGVTYGLKNVATRSLAGDDYVAGNDIEIVDQKPFFAPYKIRVNAANEVRYERMVTNNNYSTTQWVSLMLPFTIGIDKETGEYKTMGDNGEFTFYTMNSSNAFSNVQDVDDLVYDVDAHFSPYTKHEVTEANYPYLVHIDKLEKGTTEDKLLFIVRQRGSTIEPSPNTMTVAGETSTGTVRGASTQLQCFGTFSGKSLPKTEGVLYFNKDKFVSSLVLDERYSDVYVLPFRSYYVSQNPSNMRYMFISTDENTESGTSHVDTMPSGVSKAGFAYTVSDGQLTLTALKDMSVTVRSINGQTVCAAQMKNGETRSFTLPAGIYVVNGTKVVVR